VSFNTAVFFVYQYLSLAGQAPVNGHLSPTPLVAAYEDHSRKRPAPVTDILIASRGCPLTRASTVSKFLSSLLAACFHHHTVFKTNEMPSWTTANFQNFPGREHASPEPTRGSRRFLPSPRWIALSRKKTCLRAGYLPSTKSCQESLCTGYEIMMLYKTRRQTTYCAFQWNADSTIQSSTNCVFRYRQSNVRRLISASDYGRHVVIEHNSDETVLGSSWKLGGAVGRKCICRLSFQL